MRYILPVLLLIAGIDMMNRLYVPLPNDGDPKALGALMIIGAVVWLLVTILRRKRENNVANPPKG